MNNKYGILQIVLVCFIMYGSWSYALCYFKHNPLRARFIPPPPSSTYASHSGEGKPSRALEAHVPPAVRVDKLEDQRGFRRPDGDGEGGGRGREDFHRHPRYFRWETFFASFSTRGAVNGQFWLVVSIFSVRIVFFIFVEVVYGQQQLPVSANRERFPSSTNRPTPRARLYTCVSPQDFLAFALLLAVFFVL